MQSEIKSEKPDFKEIKKTSESDLKAMTSDQLMPAFSVCGPSFGNFDIRRGLKNTTVECHNCPEFIYCIQKS